MLKVMDMHYIAETIKQNSTLIAGVVGIVTLVSAICKAVSFCIDKCKKSKKDNEMQIEAVNTGEEISSIEKRLRIKIADRIDEILPCYKEDLKKLTIEDIRVLRYFAILIEIPTINIFDFKKIGTKHCIKIKNYTDIWKELEFTTFDRLTCSINTLISMGYIKEIEATFFALERTVGHEKLEKSKYIAEYKDKNSGFQYGYLRITDYGRVFCEECL